jgi:hypothetical protein
MNSGGLTPSSIHNKSTISGLMVQNRVKSLSKDSTDFKAMLHNNKALYKSLKELVIFTVGTKLMKRETNDVKFEENIK